MAPFLGPTVTPSQYPESTLFLASDFVYSRHSLGLELYRHSSSWSRWAYISLSSWKTAWWKQQRKYVPIKFLHMYTPNLRSDYMIHQYGTNENWDRMARVTKDPGWSWDNMKKYIERVISARLHADKVTTLTIPKYSTRTSSWSL